MAGVVLPSWTARASPFPSSSAEFAPRFPPGVLVSQKLLSPAHLFTHDTPQLQECQVSCGDSGTLMPTWPGGHFVRVALQELVAPPCPLGLEGCSCLYLRHLHYTKALLSLLILPVPMGPAPGSGLGRGSSPELPLCTVAAPVCTRYTGILTAVAHSLFWGLYPGSSHPQALEPDVRM